MAKRYNARGDVIESTKQMKEWKEEYANEGGENDSVKCNKPKMERRGTGMMELETPVLV